MSETNYCPNCGRSVPLGIKYCPYCGFNLGAAPGIQASDLKYCPRCGKQIPQGASYCPHCGFNLATIRGHQPTSVRAQSTAPVPGSTVTTVRRGGSTGGGFLIGFGLALLLTLMGAYMLLSQYYADIVGLSGYIDQLYSITHSPAYQGTMNALNTLSQYTNSIASAIRSIPGLSGFAEPLNLIPQAASYMRDLYSLSERAYVGVRIVAIAPTALVFGMILGIILIAIGIALVVRARGGAR